MESIILHFNQWSICIFVVNLNRNYDPKIHFLKIIFHLGIHFIFCALTTFYNYCCKLITDKIVKVNTTQKMIGFPQCKEIQIVIIYFQISSILSYCFVIGIFLHFGFPHLQGYSDFSSILHFKQETQFSLLRNKFLPEKKLWWKIIPKIL